jgi:hypothetical protein
MRDDYQIPDDPDIGKMDAAYLRTCFGLKSEPGETPPELPEAVRRAHHDMAFALSRLGATGNGMTPTQLATVYALSLRDGAQPDEEGEPKQAFPGTEYGQKVVIHWRNKDRAAHFLSMTEDKVLVLHDGDEKNIRPDLVRMPEPGEFTDVADNINACVAEST